MVVRSIIQLAHALGLKAVAEGVERQEHADFLTQEKCENMQGFFYSRPLTGDVMTQWTGSRRTS